MPAPAKPESVPPATVTSDCVKSLEGSLSVKVMVAVSPILRAALLLTIVTVGAMVSIVIVGESAPAMLPLPAASKNALLATEIEPVVVELAFGVKIAE